MPATAGRISRQIIVFGIDGYAGVWVFALRRPVEGATSVAIADSFRSIMDGAGKEAAALIVEMPIGLADRSRWRACEAKARRRLGPRRSSVFSSQLGASAVIGDYEKANAFGKAMGIGLSKQAWRLVPKIAEIDALMLPALQSRIGEGHPELAFTRLSSSPCRHPKRTPEGAVERRSLLAKAGVDADALIRALRRDHSRRIFKDDDLYDACALALTAEARIKGKAIALSNGACNAKGRAMEI
jgi:predicted RNase H-like nuclease